MNNYLIYMLEAWINLQKSTVHVDLVHTFAESSLEMDVSEAKRTTE